MPGAAQLRSLAAAVTSERRPVSPDNPFSRVEALMADAVQQCFDFTRDVRDACFELMFIGIYGSPFMRSVGQSHYFPRVNKDKEQDQLLHLPEVQAALNSISRGGLPEAVIRMLILLAGARGAVRSSRLARSAYILNNSEPFASLGADRRAHLIPEQTLIVLCAPEAAITTLIDLLPDLDTRAIAMGTVDYVAGRGRGDGGAHDRAAPEPAARARATAAGVPTDQPEPADGRSITATSLPLRWPDHVDLAP